MFMSKYGVARHIYIPIPKAGSANHAVSADWTPSAGDVKISKDGGAAANVTNLPTAIAMGNSTIWDFSITATEMQAAQVMVTVADSATKAVDDTGFILETYGNASAQHEFDLDTASTAQTGDNYARLGAPAGASVSADVAAVKTQTAAIETDTQDIQGRLPAALVSGRIDASVGAMAANTLTASAVAADAVTELQAGLSTLDAAGVRTAVGLASADLDTQLAALPTAAENADAVWDEATAGHSTAGSTGKALTDAGSAGDPWSTALPGAYGAGTAGQIVGDYLDTAVSGVSGLDAAGVRAAVGLASANLDTQLSTIDTNVDSILADTGTDGVVVASASKTGYALSATGSAALTEGYASLGAAATLPQLLYEVRALLAEKSISGTTLTAKKLDGSTTATTYTLDDATTPTAITRAT